jgi:hypothetical protein
MPPIRRQVKPSSGDESEIRSVDSAARPRQPSDSTGIRPSASLSRQASDAPPSSPSTKPAPSTRPQAGASGMDSSSLPLSRDARIEQKLAWAQERLRELPANDSRARLLQVAVLRRDEALLDGILASLDDPSR